MIEPTDEMRMVAYRDAREWAAAHGHQQPDDRMIDDVLAAVLAIVERDYRIEPKPPWEREDAVCPVHRTELRWGQCVECVGGDGDTA